MMVLPNTNELQQDKDQEVLVETGMATAPRIAGNCIPLWKWKSSYLLYLLLALSYLLIITLFGLVFSKASKISAEVSQLQEQNKDLFPCGSRTREWEYFDGQCYFFSVDLSTWHTASAHCEDKDAHLVVIHDEAEQNFIQSRTRNEKYWIGLNDLAGEGEWIWTDGTEYRNSFKKWKKGEPNDHSNKEDCAQIYEAGEWNDMPCNTKCFYVCQKPLPS
ncbi:hepatic lectin-like [Tiliqua scincoides]|uniref:hepatic lectin-like n=1 Tax=Tiliqua scincoides TaxID=71010 RepID=UPI0034629706